MAEAEVGLEAEAEVGAGPQQQAVGEVEEVLSALLRRGKRRNSSDRYLGKPLFDGYYLLWAYLVAEAAGEAMQAQEEVAAVATALEEGVAMAFSRAEIAAGASCVTQGRRAIV